MTSDQIRERFSDLNVWKQGDQRAPHKPLLLLLALARAGRGEDRLMSFAEIEAPLKDLLGEFGPPRRSHHAHLPFWHLQTDGIWEIVSLPVPAPGTIGDTPAVTLMRAGNVRGGLVEEIHSAIVQDKGLLREAALTLLETSFPETLHGEIANAVGLELKGTAPRVRARDPRFRDRILIAYGYRCAVCRYDLKMVLAPIGLEAAHIKWHQAGGPAVEQNGLALCSMHHLLFDRGAMTLGSDRRMRSIAGLGNTVASEF
jgi:putative restriction endonuclease